MESRTILCQSRLLLSVLLWATTVGIAVPPNDECTQAIAVTEGYDYEGYNTGATGFGSNSCGGTVTNDVWHLYSPKFTGTHTISLCGSEFDTALAVYNACGGTELVCNDDFCGYQSQASLYLYAGVDYYLRISGYNGATGNYTLSVGYDTLAWGVPFDGTIVGGYVPFFGIAYDHLCASNYTVEYRPSSGTWQPVDSSQPVYWRSVINEYFAVWDTRNGIPDGTYELKVELTDACSNSAVETRSVTVDNTSPIAIITSPASNAYVIGTVPIIGSAMDAHLLNWSLQYAGPSGGGWITISSSTLPVINGILAYWDTSSLNPGVYMLRLVVNDQAVIDDNEDLHNQSIHQVGVHIGLKGDLNMDRAVNLHDLTLMAGNWLTAY